MLSSVLPSYTWPVNWSFVLYARNISVPSVFLLHYSLIFRVGARSSSGLHEIARTKTLFSMWFFLPVPDDPLYFKKEQFLYFQCKLALLCSFPFGLSPHFIVRARSSFSEQNEITHKSRCTGCTTLFCMWFCTALHLSAYWWSFVL